MEEGLGALVYEGWFPVAFTRVCVGEVNEERLGEVHVDNG